MQPRPETNVCDRASRRLELCRTCIFTRALNPGTGLKGGSTWPAQRKSGWGEQPGLEGVRQFGSGHGVVYGLPCSVVVALFEEQRYTMT